MNMQFLASVILLAHFTAPFLVLGMKYWPSIIKTSDGPVKGTETYRFGFYKGIRYGKSPVGNLRFKPPVPVEPWTDPEDVADESCVMPTKNAPFGLPKCLTLDIVTPVTNATPPSLPQTPVLVQFFHGSFTSDSQSIISDLKEKWITYVLVSYRLGVFGFLNMDHPDATGNQGLKDQVLALKWVRKNIHHFGGNPNNVTIMGLGAAAASVGYHVLSSASAGLFDGAISMSGTPLAPNSFVPRAEAVHRGKTLARIINHWDQNTPWTKQSAMEILQAATDEELVQASFLLDKEFGPTLENPSIAKDLFLSECMISTYESGKFNKVPQLIGFKEPDLSDSMGYEFAVDANKIRLMMNEVTKWNDSRAPKLNRIPDDWLAVGLQSVSNAVTESLIKGPIRHTVKFLIANNDEKPVYYYERVSTATVKCTYSNSMIDVFHGETRDNCAISEDRLMLDNNRAYIMWTNFVKYGNPTPGWIKKDSLDITWPAAGSSGQALQISDELKVVPFEPARFSLPNVCDVQ